MKDRAERLAQAIHALGLFDLEQRAREGEWLEMGKSGARKRVLIQELDFASKRYDSATFHARLLDKLRTAIIHGDYD